jgi:hypothetical protein
VFWSGCKPCLDWAQPHGSMWRWELRTCAAPQKRKGFEGLYGLVRDRLLCEPLSGHLFLFESAMRTTACPVLGEGAQL